MVRAKKSHDWDLFAPLICYVANQWSSKDHQLQIADIHPYRKETVKPFTAAGWNNITNELKD
jgi:hypothetical protein